MREGQGYPCSRQDMMMMMNILLKSTGLQSSKTQVDLGSTHLQRCICQHKNLHEVHSLLGRAVDI